MNFSELIDELQDRGFSYLSDTRAGRFINFARAELDSMYLWPYREDSATGTAPLTITDLGVIEAVSMNATDVMLSARDYGGLLRQYGDLAATGTPHAYYVAWPAGVPVVATYPVTTATIDVQYYRIQPDLTGVQTPAAPTQYHMLIVDIAARDAYYDSDNPAAAESLQRKIDRRVAQMVDHLLGGQSLDGTGEVQIMTGQSVDG